MAPLDWYVGPWPIVEINNTGVIGQFLPPKNDLEHARGPVNPDMGSYCFS